jgi:oxaloacetate decarboxylase beta subunit
MIIGNIPLFPGMSVGIYEEGSVLNILYHGVQKGMVSAADLLGIGAMTDFLRSYPIKNFC